MNAYGSFAHTYDRMMHDVDYDAWSEYLISFLKRAGVKTVAECACGTGQITIRLAKAGFMVVGSDISEDMLMEARENALRSGLRFLPFVQESMTELSVHHPMDAVVCACDGVNYLTEPDSLDAFFNSASKCLKPGGLLLFDVSSAYKLEHILGNQTFTEVQDSYAYIWENTFDPDLRLTQMDLTCFIKEGTYYRRFSEQHLQRAYSEAEINEALARAGYELLGVYAAFTEQPQSDTSDRIQWIAKKK